MNPYEEKLKEAIAYAIRNIESRQKSIVDTKEAGQKASKQDEALRQSIEILKEHGDEEAIEVLEDKRDKLAREKQQLGKMLEDSQRYLREDRQRLETLRRACPHVESEYDHTDYHKNEEFRKCKLCGEVF